MNIENCFFDVFSAFKLCKLIQNTFCACVANNRFLNKNRLFAMLSMSARFDIIVKVVVLHCKSLSGLVILLTKTKYIKNR